MMKWYALAILFLVSVVNTIDKLLIPALAEPLMREFNLSDGQFGFLVGIIFSVSYGLASIPIGLMIDRYNRTRLLAALLFIWSGMTLLGARVSSFGGLVLCRMGVAVAESGGNPATLSLIGDYFPKEQRSRAIGIFSTNAAVAAVLVFSLAGIIAAEHGWRMVFVVAAIPGFVLALVVLFTLPEPPRGQYDQDDHQIADQKHYGLGEILRAIKANKPLLWVVLAGVLVIIGQTGGNAFVSAFMVRVHDFPLEKAGVITGVLMGLGFALGTVGGGIIADKASRGDPGGGCRFVGLVTLAAVPIGVFAFTVPSFWLSIPALFVWQVLSTCFYGATLSTILTLAPVAIRGSVVTYATLCMNLFGYGLGPQFAGMFSDFYRLMGISAHLQWGLASVLVFMLISAFCYLGAARRLAAP